MKTDSKTEYDFLIVGAGLFGSVFARQATDRGYRCLVIDKRRHTGGNVYCEKTAGINVHKYGAHIFHTSNSEVWNYVNSFVRFNRYTNSPVAMAPDGKLYNLPFNMNTFYGLWGVKTPEAAVEKLEQQKSEATEALKGRAPRNLEEQALTLVGKDIFNLLIKGYTEKQWGRKCSQLPPEIIRRLPLRLTFDNNYFNDSYQGIPEGGYNPLIEGLLKGSEVITGCDYFANKHLGEKARHIVYTGPIDQFFEYKLGRLEYRTVNFETEVLNIPNFQGNAVVNYTSADVPYTRIIEHKHFEAFGNDVYDNPVTVVSKEYSTEWNPRLEPYYPVNDERNGRLYSEYRDLVDELNKEAGVVEGSMFGKRYIFGGRLAEYKYYDMAPLIESCMKLFND